MTGTLEAITALAVWVWAATEGVGKVVTWRKDRIALLLGPVSALVAHLVGWFPGLPGGWEGFLAAAWFGLLGTLAAGLGNDYVAKAVQGPKATP